MAENTFNDVGHEHAVEPCSKTVFGQTFLMYVLHFQPGIALDECHRAKNQGKFEDTDKGQASDKDKGSKTAKLVKQMQEILPFARIIYVSATGASGMSRCVCICMCVYMYLCV